MPTTPEGKAISSRNSLRHGCCSKILIISGEREEDLIELCDGWLADYDPQTEPALALVLEAVKQYWFLLRAERWFNRTLQQLPEDITQWSEQDHKSVERATRYHTAAQRGFHRAFNDLEHYYKTHGYQKKPAAPVPPPPSEPRTLVRDTALPQPKNPFTGKNAKKNQRQIPILDQWVEITVDDQGNTVTKLYPSNQDLIKEGHTMDPPPELVYRRLHFVGSVPPEYHWSTKSPERRAAGGMAVQRMSVETWFETIQREKEKGTGHIGPCRSLLPRPPERGGCECPVCTRLSSEASLANS